MVCRNGQHLWALPGLKFETLLGQLPGLSSAETRREAGPFRPAGSGEEIGFLPALFQVTDAGDETAGRPACRVLDATLIPELARLLNGAAGRRSLGRRELQAGAARPTGPQWHSCSDLMPSMWFPFPAAGNMETGARPNRRAPA